MKKLLLIDDSRTYLAAIRKFLSDCVIDVTTVETFPGAEDIIDKGPPDIVCVDYDIRDSKLNGEQWVVKVHSQIQRSEIAIVTGTPEAVNSEGLLEVLGVEVVGKQSPQETRFWQRIKRQHLAVDNSAKSRPPYVSVFISYGGPDEKLAKTFYNKLQEHGVPVFFFSENAPIGKKLHHVMRDGIAKHDRVLLLCSERSLTRPGVLNEIEEALQRESLEGGQERLMPCALDDYVGATGVRSCNVHGPYPLILSSPGPSTSNRV